VWVAICGAMSRESCIYKYNSNSRESFCKKQIVSISGSNSHIPYKKSGFTYCKQPDLVSKLPPIHFPKKR
jgi:hypothetical protein